MTLHDFVQTIKESGKVNDSLDQITIELYRESEIALSGDTIIAVRKGKRKASCKQAWLNEFGFLQYFEKKTNSTWPQMQESFRKLNESGIIDCDTTDRRVFYESLLAMFYDILRFVPASLCDILPQEPLIFGRKMEMEQLAEIFRYNNYAVITGIGGSGKSCLALAYAHNLKKHGHWTVQHIICENGDTLQSAVSKLQFSGLEDVPRDKKDAEKQNFENRFRCLKSSIKQRLIVLDNLNRPFTQEDRDILKKLAECGTHVRFLITSRSRQLEDKRCVINLSPLDDDDLLKLYAYHRFCDFDDHKDYFVQHKDALMKIFSLIERHALLAIVLAKLPSRIFIEEQEIYSRLASGLRISSQGIVINKDGKMTEIPAEGLVRMLFDISDMSDAEKSVMKYMSIMPPAGIEIKLFQELTRCSRKEILSLKKSNWIILDEEKMTIRLHPLICEAILSFDDTRFTRENCANFVDSVKKRRDTVEEYSPTWHTLNKILACVGGKIYFREITACEGFDFLNSRYKEALFNLNECVIWYTNDDNVDDDNVDDDNVDDDNDDDNVDDDDSKSPFAEIVQ